MVQDGEMVSADDVLAKIPARNHKDQELTTRMSHNHANRFGDAANRRCRRR
jgi:hypothetical protein